MLGTNTDPTQHVMEQPHQQQHLTLHINEIHFGRYKVPASESALFALACVTWYCCRNRCLSNAKQFPSTGRIKTQLASCFVMETARALVSYEWKLSKKYRSVYRRINSLVFTLQHACWVKHVSFWVYLYLINMLDC